MSFLHALRGVVVTPLNVFLWLVITVLMTIAGPFGTNAAWSYSFRALNWLVVVGLAILISHTLLLIISRRAPRISILKRGLLISAGMVIFYAPLLILITKLTTVLRDKPVTPWPILVFYVGAISLSIAIAQWLVQLQHKSTPRLLERLPESRWGNVIRLTSNDHRVEVVTDKGVETILMRFADALAELEGIDGVRVHRSHWVARQAVLGQSRENGRVFLNLVDGVRVPVSRGYLDAAKQAGLLEDRAA
ncbi:MAG: LytTR family DNA-binding domain-containing protein [Paracoccaceae bacterium]